MAATFQENYNKLPEVRRNITRGSTSKGCEPKTSILVEDAGTYKKTFQDELNPKKSITHAESGDVTAYHFAHFRNSRGVTRAMSQPRYATVGIRRKDAPTRRMTTQ